MANRTGKLILPIGAPFPGTNHGAAVPCMRSFGVRLCSGAVVESASIFVGAAVRRLSIGIPAIRRHRRRYPMSKHPNIVILMCDQMQHNRMGFVDGIAHTPSLDRLATDGVHFTHMITQHGQCVPSRAVFMTGQSAHECGVMVNYGFKGRNGTHNAMLTRKHRTFASVCRDAGYETVYFGKGHLGSPLADLGFDKGYVNDGVKIEGEQAEKLGIAHVPMNLRKEYTATDDAVEFLTDYEPGEKPLLFFFSTNLPHPPFFTEKKYAELFPPEEMVLPASFSEESFEGKPGYQRDHVYDGKHGAFDENQMKKEISDYYTMIAMADEQVGRIISELVRLGLYEETLVMFIADHGDMMGAHRMHKKGVIPYDELYRVPCIAKLPTGSDSKRPVIDDLLCSQSVPGTILSLAGLEVPDSFTGGDFTDAFDRDSHPEDERVFFEHYLAYWGLHPFYGVRTRDRKYIHYYGKDDTEELYDLDEDPLELTNMSDDPRYGEEKSRFAKQADEWWRSTGGRDVEYYESDYFRNNEHNKP